MKRLGFIALFLILSATAARAQAPDGKALYDANCKKCHGVRGIPPQTIQRKYEKIMKFDAEFIARHSTDSIVTVLTRGKDEDMKSFADKLSNDEMAAVARYVHELAGKAKASGN